MPRNARMFFSLAAVWLAALQPAGANEFRDLFGTIAGEIVREQMRQQQRVQPQAQPQARHPARTPQQVQPQQPRRQRAQPAAPQPQQPRMSLEERMAVQRALAAAGHYSGEIDGIIGPGSRSAIARWQAAMGANATGYLLGQQARNLIDIAPPPAPVLAAPIAPHDTHAVPGPEFGHASASPSAAWGVAPTAVAGAAPVVATVLPAPAPATSAPPADAIRGDEELNDRLIIWSTATNPGLLEDDIVILRLAEAGLAPALRAQRIIDPGVRREMIREALPGPDMAPPSRVVLERMASVQPAWDGQPASFRTDFQTVDGMTTITEIPMRMWRRATGSPGWTFRLDRPFYMQDPPGFEAWAIPPQDRAELLLQIDMTLSDLRPVIDTSGYGAYRGGSATAQINSISLIRRAPPPRRQGNPAVPDEVLHVWTGGQAPDSAVPNRPADAAALAALYGGAASGGRYVIFPHHAGNLFDQTQRPLLAGDWGMMENALPLALALRRVVEAAPDRLPDVALTDRMSQHYLTQRQRLDLFPIEIAQRDPSGNVSELALHAAMSANAQAVRDIALSRAPDLPLPLRWVGRTNLGEYDFGIQGFPVALGTSIYRQLPLAGPGPEMSLDIAVKLPPAEAQAVLERLEQLSPGGGEGRVVFVVVDYALDEMALRAAGQGPITEAELGTLVPRSRIESAALYLDPGLTEKLMDLPVPQVQAPARAVEGPGEALYATTGLSLWGAVVRADTAGEMTRAAFNDMQRIHRAGNAGRDARVAALIEEARAAALDSYWVGLRFTPGEYDPTTGRLQISDPQFRPVPYDNDITGIEAPQLVPADDESYAAILVTPDEAGAIGAIAEGRRSVAAYALVRPAGIMGDANGYGMALTVGAPERLMIGPDMANSLPEPVVLSVTLQARAQAAATMVNAGDPIPPEALLLDQEGVDLLALSLDPGLYDDAAWTRMLVERLMRERWHATDADPARGSLPWGTFFPDPALTPDAGGVRALLPAFRAWTEKRIAALPPLVAIPWGEVPVGIPGCQGARDLLAGEISGSDKSLIANALALAGTDATPAAGHLDHSDRPRPGEDRLFLHDSSSAHVFCRYPRLVGQGTLAALIPEGAGHVSALTSARAVPNPGPERHNTTGLLVTLRRDTLRLAPADRLADAPEGLRAVLVAAGSVERVSGWRRSPDGQSHESALDLSPPDWAPAEAAKLAASDIVGLTLGTPLATFEEAARAHLGEAVLFTEKTPGKGMFGHARGLLNPATGEALAAVYAPQAEGQPVVAIMRRLALSEGQADAEALKRSLVGKYGEITREAFANAWLWGTLPHGEDGWGVCGGDALLGRPDREHAPMLTPTTSFGQPEGSYLSRPDFWFEAGWPEIVADRPGQIDPARCGPVVAGMVIDAPQGGSILQVWLMDRKMAGEFEVLAQPTAPVLDIKL